MDGQTRIRSILKREKTNGGFWLGNPSEEAKRKYFAYFGIREEALSEVERENLKNSVLTSETVGIADIQLAQRLGSDLMWFSPELDLGSWRHPEKKPMWDVLAGRPRHSLGDEGIFAETEDIREVEAFDWPNPDYLDFDRTLQNAGRAEQEGLAVFGGMWCPFFHVVSDFFGMENYFIKMHTDPDVVEAVTEHVTEFYLEANRRCFDLMGDRLTCAFFGNDLGSQLGCLISLPFFDRFIAPYAKRLIDQMKRYGLPIAMHSCGAIFELIPRLIELGVDVLHPLQAKAVGMDAQALQDAYGRDLVFMGGVDTQELLPFATPREVGDEVRRLKDTFRGAYIVSPSHEALLANVPIENVIAMSEAAKE